MSARHRDFLLTLARLRTDPPRFVIFREAYPPMKVVFLLRSLNYGGAERQVSLLAQGLKRRGHEVKIAVFYPGVQDATIATSTAPLIHLGKRGRWDLVSFLVRTWRVLRAERPDVVYSLMPVGNIVSALLKLFMPSLKVVWGIRASRLDLSHYERFVRVSQLAETSLSWLINGVISNSAGGLKALPHACLARSTVIPNGVDQDLFCFDPDKRAALRRQLGVDDGEILVGMVARLDPMKDHPTFLKAAGRMLRARQGLRFLCVVDGSSWDIGRLKAIADEAGIADILFLRHTDDILPIYCALDLLVLSSAFGEGFPNVVLEALACGLPAVVTDVGSAAEAVGDPARVARPQDPDHLAATALSVISAPAFRTPAERRRLREQVCSVYSLDRLLDSTETFLRRCAGHPAEDGNRTVVMVIGSLKLGGAERHLVAAAPALAARGWKPVIYLFSEQGALAPALIDAGFPVVGSVARMPRYRHLPRPIRGFLVLVDLVCTLRRLRPAACHCFLPHGCIVGGAAAMIARVPRIVMSRLSLNNYQAASSWQAEVERFLMRRADAVLGNAGAVIAQLREERIPDRLLGTVYTGLALATVDGGPRRDAIRAAEGLAEDALVLMIVANLHDYKGHTHLLAALGAIAPSLPAGWRLICVGEDAGALAALTAQVAELGIADNVRFAGGRPDAGHLWRAADIGLLVSLQEGFSLSILEGMAAELPMVVTDVGGNAEAIIDGKCGQVVPPADPQALAVAILKYAADESIRRRHGQAGRQRLERLFTLDVCLDSYTRLYAELPAPPGRSVQSLIDAGLSPPS